VTGGGDEVETTVLTGTMNWVAVAVGEGGVWLEHPLLNRAINNKSMVVLDTVSPLVRPIIFPLFSVEDIKNCHTTGKTPLSF
jgi:hypothetical protein